MNTGFYKDLDTNFQQALELSEQAFTQEELIGLLKNGNIPEKQIAALRIETVNSVEEADVLISNLIGCDGKIREAVALKINQLLSKDQSIINLFNKPELFANSSIDINANICRLTIDSVAILIKDESFAKKYLNKVLIFINESFEELDKFIFRDKKYVINKQLFKLYWSLEAIKLFSKDLPKEVLLPILKRVSKEREYTIREKAAQILTDLEDSSYDDLKEILKNDENYYVRAAMSSV